MLLGPSNRPQHSVLPLDLRLFGHRESLTKLIDFIHLDRMTKVYWPDPNEWNAYQPCQFRDWALRNLDESELGQFLFDANDETGCSSWYGIDAEKLCKSSYFGFLSATAIFNKPRRGLPHVSRGNHCFCHRWWRF